MPQTGWLAQQKYIPHTPGGCNSKIKVPSGLISPEASPRSLQMAAFFPCPHEAAPLYPGPLLSPPLIRTPAPLEEGQPQWPHINLITSAKSLCPNTFTFWNAGGWSFNEQILREHKSLQPKPLEVMGTSQVLRLCYVPHPLKCFYE